MGCVDEDALDKLYSSLKAAKNINDVKKALEVYIIVGQERATEDANDTIQVFSRYCEGAFEEVFGCKFGYLNNFKGIDWAYADVSNSGFKKVSFQDLRASYYDLLGFIRGDVFTGKFSE